MGLFKKIFGKSIITKLDTEIVSSCPLCDVEECQTFEDLNVIEQGLQLRYFCHNCGEAFIINYVLNDVIQEVE